MKKIFLIALTAALVGCAEKTGYVITGQAGDKDGQAVLTIFGEDGESVSDTVAMKAGSFKFKGETAEVCNGAITVTPDGGEPVKGSLYVENARIKYTMDLSKTVDYGKYGGLACIETKAEGGRNNDFSAAVDAIRDSVSAVPEYAEYAKAAEELMTMGYSDMDAYRAKSEEIRSTYKDVIPAYYEAINTATRKCIESHPDCEAAASLYNRIGTNDSLEDKIAAFENFTPEVQSCSLAKSLADEIQALKATSPGAEAPDFTLKDRDGNDVTLSSLRGQYVIVDFWASWCKPCRAGMPAMKELYAKYHSKGLEIIGVSDDDNYDKWVKALDEDQLPWINVKDEFPIKNRPARVGQLYATHYIPSYFLLDPDGKVIGKMEHEELAAALAERLD